ncbi:MAG: hypothetical protein GY953_47970 [bacterium]|nr:hypothetical protein [bacterium]
MLTKIAPDIYDSILEESELDPVKASDAIGKGRQIIYRIRKGEQLLNAADEAALVKRANLSKEAFGRIACKALSKFLGRPVMASPKSGFRPASPLMRSDDLYLLHHDRLPPKVRERIKAKLRLGRLIDVAADQAADLFDQEIRQMIEDALGPEALLDSDQGPVEDE